MLVGGTAIAHAGIAASVVPRSEASGFFITAAKTSPPEDSMTT